MIYRNITPHLEKLATLFPVVTILGPRQSGKTTLARMTFKNYSYANLELPPVRQLAREDPQTFFVNFPAPLIIDEVQHAPELLSYIQVFVDEHKARGQYILTGSHQPLLQAKVTQSLAGRTALLTLLPLSLPELANAGFSMNRDDWLFKGFMPRIYDESIPPTLLYENYYRTYVERDVRQLINVKDQNAFETFVRLLAGRVGQVVNLESMSNDIGVSSPTLAAWLSVLEASYIVFKLHPYYNNFGKRLIKSPKIYFTDVGLASYLLRIENRDQIARDPLVGGLFENLVVLEALKARYNAGLSPDLYYFRDSSGLEIDLILDQARQLHAFEIKSSRTWNSAFGKNMEKFRERISALLSSTVIYAGEPIAGSESRPSCVHFTKTASLFVKTPECAGL